MPIPYCPFLLLGRFPEVPEHSVGKIYLQLQFLLPAPTVAVVMLHGRYGQGDIRQKLMRPIDFEPVINALVRPVKRFAGIEPLPISRLPRYRTPSHCFGRLTPPSPVRCSPTRATLSRPPRPQPPSTGMEIRPHTSPDRKVPPENGHERISRMRCAHAHSILSLPTPRTVSGSS